MNITKTWLILLVILISASGFLISQYQAFLSPFTINEDIRTDSFMHRFHDKLLFRNDYFADFFELLVKFYCPFYYFIYFILTYFFRVSLSHLLVSFSLFVIASLYMFNIGLKLKDIKAGLYMVLLFIFYFWITADYSGGTRNVFGKTILIIFLYYLIQKNNRGIMLSVLGMALFYYPLLFPIGLTVIFLILSYDASNKGAGKKPLIYSVVIIITAFLLLAYVYYSKIIPLYGRLFNRNEIANMPIFGLASRANIFPFPSLFEIFFNFVIQFKFMSLTFVILCFVVGKRLFLLPFTLYVFLASSLLMYKAAILFAFKFNMPLIYFDFVMPIFLIIFCAIGMSLLSDKLISRRSRLSASLAFVLMLGLLHYSEICPGLTSYRQIKLYEFVESLPKDAVIAGYPDDMDEVAFFSKRKFFVARELAYPICTKYYNEVKRRIDAFFLIYYTDSPRLAYDLCKKNGVDYLVVDSNHFQKDFLEKGDFFDEPFNDYIKSIVKGRSYFALSNIPQHLKIFLADNKFIIRSDSLLLLQDK